ncbi:MAG: hypothetical protein ACO3IB_12440, partial [Phycisphaerales bacterium]
AQMALRPTALALRMALDPAPTMAPAAASMALEAGSMGIGGAMETAIARGIAALRQSRGTWFGAASDFS